MRAFSLICVMFVCTEFVSADVVLTPVANTPYRLVFVTSNNFAPNAGGSIAAFNAIVTAQANLNPTLAGLGTTWSVIGSTASVDARDNTNTNPITDGAGVAIYNTGGQLMATSNADLWDGNLQNAVGFNQFGNAQGNAVYTGTKSDGTKFTGAELGNASARFGASSVTNSTWMDQGTFSPALGLFAMSGVLFNGAPPAPAAVPEPTTFLALSGICASAWAVSRRREILESSETAA